MTVGQAARALFRGPGGIVRAVGVACVLVAVVVRGPVDTALFALVLAGLVAPPAAGAPRALDAAYGIGLIVAAWSGALDLYQSVGWLDVVMHLVVTGLVAAVAHLLLARRTGAALDPAAAAGGGQRAGVVAVTASLGLALSVLWEIGEYLGNTYVDDTIYVGYADTIGDLVAGGIGSAVAGLWLTAARATGRAGSGPST
ncbi:hypothetical protein J1G42_05270 [Cellulomonas sp. zg-ZUI222]|uniref:DUF2238 domain-containing protein n=1 Tax=Cellulomonas wangleii TaxID=2816956 RepID=A0ABX8D6L0_9CELL|nr:hypothetical protein [Cellulomonas wangleii]MBO0920234.1 hypothetical protein [Cellulomonas wangleii]MBO0923340.1 hypothetical protein [Cellulomonas wangleii]QVI61697.1 hypothetical protein KG103_14730 [Cellulomonas wangleii]